MGWICFLDYRFKKKKIRKTQKLGFPNENTHHGGRSFAALAGAQDSWKGSASPCLWGVFTTLNNLGNKASKTHRKSDWTARMHQPCEETVTVSPLIQDWSEPAKRKGGLCKDVHTSYKQPTGTLGALAEMPLRFYNLEERWPSAAHQQCLSRYPRATHLLACLSSLSSPCLFLRWQQKLRSVECQALCARSRAGSSQEWPLSNDHKSAKPTQQRRRLRQKGATPRFEPRIFCLQYQILSIKETSWASNCLGRNKC